MDQQSATANSGTAGGGAVRGSSRAEAAGIAAATLPVGWVVDQAAPLTLAALAGAAPWAVTAADPEGRAVTVLALDPDAARGALQARATGALVPGDGWAPPVGDNARAGDLLDPTGSAPSTGMTVEELVAAEVTGLLPDGWEVAGVEDVVAGPGATLSVAWAQGPGGGRLVAASARGAVDAYRQLARLLQGELAVDEAFAVT